MIVARKPDGRAALMVERAGAQKRLATLMATVDGLDLYHDADRLADLRAAMRALFRRIEHCDAVLHPEPSIELPKVAQPRTPREAKLAARARLRVLSEALYELPESCREAAKMLRRSIRREMKLIERAKNEGG